MLLSVYIDRIMEYMYENGPLKLFKQCGKNTILDVFDVNGLDKVLIQCFSISAKMPMNLFGWIIKT